jgi:hypothetical protein
VENKFLLQKTYKTLEDHKKGIRRHLRSWNAPSLERLIEATQADSILLSNIYQRQVPCGYQLLLAPCSDLHQNLGSSLPCNCKAMLAAMQALGQLESIDVKFNNPAIMFVLLDIICAIASCHVANTPCRHALNVVSGMVQAGKTGAALV